MAIVWLEGIAALRDLRARVPGEVGFVPTMGALHAGHISLVERAKRDGLFSIVSIFVNPLQFGPSEDYGRYPRDPDGDRRLLEAAGTDAAFTVTPEEMYPAGFATRVIPEGPALALEGAARPGHFAGVCTVVLKLFGLVRPARAYFGQKDFQQTVVIRRMVADLNVPVDVVVCPTLRDPDGLAMSSRNRYLSPAERREALSLSQGLADAARLFAAGERSAGALADAVRARIAATQGMQVEYVSVNDPGTLAPREDDARKDDVILVAARAGKTRLIDNRVL